MPLSTTDILAIQSDGRTEAVAKYDNPNIVVKAYINTGTDDISVNVLFTDENAVPVTATTLNITASDLIAYDEDAQTYLDRLSETIDEYVQAYLQGLSANTGKTVTVTSK